MVGEKNGFAAELNKEKLQSGHTETQIICEGGLKHCFDKEWSQAYLVSGFVFTFLCYRNAE